MNSPLSRSGLPIALLLGALFLFLMTVTIMALIAHGFIIGGTLMLLSCCSLFLARAREFGWQMLPCSWHRIAAMCIVSLIAISIASADDELAVKAEAYVRQAKAVQKRMIAALEKEYGDALANLKRRDPRRTRQEAAKLKGRVEGLEQELKKLRKSELPVPTIDLFDLEVGQIGKLLEQNRDIKVVQVLGPKKMHVIPERTATRLRFSGFAQSQSFYTDRGNRVLLRGVSTTGLTDGESVSIDKVLEVVDTETYKTVLGATATIFVLEPFDMEAAKPYIDSMTRPQPRIRKWSDATGEYSMAAEFIDFRGEKAHLKKEDGSVVQVPVSRLSKADQQYIRNACREANVVGNDRSRSASDRERVASQSGMEETGKKTPANSPSTDEADNLAEIELLQDGEFVELEPNARLWDDRQFFWVEVPPALAKVRFLRNPSAHQGTTKFKVTRSGTLLMAVTDRWKSSGGGGTWERECVTKEQLAAQGWQQVYRLRSDQLAWTVFKRKCREGESLSYRTEKYCAPILILPDNYSNADSIPSKETANSGSEGKQPRAAITEDADNSSSQDIEYTVVAKEDISYLGCSRMVYRVVLNVATLPSEEQVRKVATRLWNEGSKGLDEFTVFVYLPEMSTDSWAYAVCEFRPSGLKELQVNEEALAFSERERKERARSGSGPVSNLPLAYRLEPKKRYSLSRKTPVMPAITVEDAIASQKKILYIAPESEIVIRGVQKREDSEAPWYEVEAFAENGAPLGEGWINSIALIGQELVVAGTDDKSITVRVWTDKTGKFRIDAQYMYLAAGNVRLRKKDGSEITVPMEKLSDEDQEWIRNRLK